MSDKKGVIYILTNPSFPEFVKIGYADDINRRLTELNKTECTPFAFRVYATYAVDERLSDLKIHNMIDRINPSLRSIDTINEKKRVREFFEMSAEDAFAMFEAMAEIHGTKHLLTKVKPDKKEAKEAETAEAVKERARERWSPFSFDLVQICPGSELEFWYTTRQKSDVKCVVVDNKHIRYNDEIYTLTSLATKLLESKYSVAGPSYFKYKGEWLNDIRKRMGV